MWARPCVGRPERPGGGGRRPARDSHRHGADMARLDLPRCMPPSLSDGPSPKRSGNRDADPPEPTGPDAPRRSGGRGFSLPRHLRRLPARHGRPDRRRHPHAGGSRPGRNLVDRRAPGHDGSSSTSCTTSSSAHAPCVPCPDSTQPGTRTEIFSSLQGHVACLPSTDTVDRRAVPPRVDDLGAREVHAQRDVPDTLLRRGQPVGLPLGPR